jgi:hypothetical protein
MGYKLDNSGIRSQGKHFVGSDTEVSLPGSLMVLEKAANLLKDLFHDSVLPQVVISPFEL